MSLTRKGYSCGGCGRVLAPACGGGQPMRPRWPGYEVQAHAPDGKTYTAIRCAHCDGPPPPTGRQLLRRLPGYALGMGLCLLSISRVGVNNLQAIAAAGAAAAMLAWILHQRRASGGR